MEKDISGNEAVARSMFGALGLEIISEDKELIRAKMPVNRQNSQAFGVLCGGASLAFAEIIAGYGSFLHCPQGYIPVGSQVTGNHVSSVKTEPGVFVYAEAKPLHLGRTTHLWNVDIRSKEGRLVSAVRVTNFIVKDKTENWK